jgi:FKBP-type peptidyl-prolyl cis-trans isomerase
VLYFEKDLVMNRRQVQTFPATFAFFALLGLALLGSSRGAQYINYDNAQDIVLSLKHTMGRAKVAAESKPIKSSDALKYIKQMQTILKDWATHIVKSTDENGKPKVDKAAARDEEIEFSYNATFIPEKCSTVTVEGSRAKVHYVGKLMRNNKVFDSSFHTGSMPLRFTIGDGDGKVPGWDKGTLGMCKGERRNLFVPYADGYGETGSGSVPPYSNLKYTLELVEFSGPSGASSETRTPTTTKKPETDETKIEEPEAPSGGEKRKKRKKKKKNRKKKKKRGGKKDEL